MIRARASRTLSGSTAAARARQTVLDMIERARARRKAKDMTPAEYLAAVAPRTGRARSNAT
jgi:hypothetical protein